MGLKTPGFRASAGSAFSADPARLQSSPFRNSLSPWTFGVKLQGMTTVRHSAAHAPRPYPNLIDGDWVPSVSGQTFENRNPATGELIGLFQKSTAADAERAIDAARRAYEHWRLVPAPKRAELLFRAAQLLAERKEALARDMTREMGKVLDETRGDVQEAIDMTYFMAGEGRRQYGQTVPSELRDKFAMSIRQPLGVCGIITPWNFPMAIPSWKIIPALVCGNTVVFKPATLTPLSAINFVKILEEAGIPRGVVNLVTGGGGDVGNALLVSDAVRVVSFTGSTEVGRTVSSQAAPSFKKVHLEMGGKNVIMIMDDANLELAVEGCLWGGFGTSGQRCTAASRVVVHEKVYRAVPRTVRRAGQGAARRRRPRSRDADGTVGQPRPARHRHEVRRDRPAGRRAARLRRPSR